MTMDKFEILLGNHNAATTETEQLALVKDYMLSLPKDELIKFLTESPTAMVEDLKFMVHEGGEEGRAAAKTALPKVEEIFKQFVPSLQKVA